MKDFKGFSIFLIPYLFACSGLYHIAYWDTFDINGLAYIGLTELIKAFIYPFLSFGFSFIIGLLISEIGFRIDDWWQSDPPTSFKVKGSLQQPEFMPSGGGRNTKIGKVLNSKLALFILVILWGLLVLFVYRWNSTQRWLIWAFTVSVVPYVFLDRAGLFNSIFENNSIRQQVIRLIIYIPIFSFAAGKYESELVYKNIKYKYLIKEILLPKSDSLKNDTIKLIGSSEQYLFMTDLKNSTILLIRSDKIDSLKLQQH